MRTPSKLILPLLFLALGAGSSPAQSGAAAPRLGTVSSPISCAPGVQAPFNQGVAWLHSFEFEEAEKSFHEVAQQDPGCAMAYWGIALGLWHPLWEPPDRATLEQGAKAIATAEKLGGKTPRERAYIAAVAAYYQDYGKPGHLARAAAYSQAMQKVHEDNPQDLEAAAFYGLSLLAAEPSPDPGWSYRLRAARVLEKVFAQEPEHPGAAHYLIHAYDAPALAKRGLKAARVYAQIAPASPHALHMPSHIFTRLGLWPESIASNLAAEAAAKKRLGMGGAGHALHALDFLNYAYLQSGRQAQAQQTLREVAEAEWASPEMRSNLLARLQVRVALESRDWKKAATLEAPAGAGTELLALAAWARALGKARAGDAAGARRDLQVLEGLRRTMQADPERYGPQTDAIESQEAEAWIAQSEGKGPEALAAMRAALQQEDAAGGPDLMSIPVDQMLGDLLLEQQRPAEALAAYEAALQQSPNRFNSLYGAARAAESAGKKEEARGYYQQLLNMCSDSDEGRAELRQARAFLKSAGMD